MRANRLWLPVLLGPVCAGVVYFICLTLIAPQDPYCERTAMTFPWWGGASVNVWGAIGIGLIGATGLGIALASRRSGVSGPVRAGAILGGIALVGFLVTFAYLVPYLDHSCGE